MPKIPVVFVPGLTADARLWEPVLEELSDVVDPLVAPTQGDTIAAMADEVFAIAPERFYIAGTSMGGYVALDVALRGDDRVAGLVLANTSARAANPAQQERGNSLIAEVQTGDFAGVVKKLAKGVAGGKEHVEELAARMAVDAGVEAFLRQQRAVVARQDRREELSGITVPTLVVAGDDDKITPPSLNNEIARLIPAAELQIVPGSGHLTTIDATGELSAIIRTWLLAQESGPETGRESN